MSRLVERARDDIAAAARAWFRLRHGVPLAVWRHDRVWWSARFVRTVDDDRGPGLLEVRVIGPQLLTVLRVANQVAAGWPIRTPLPRTPAVSIGWTARAE